MTESGSTVSAVPAQWRTDITDPYDLVEEVVRIVGYDKVPSVLADSSSRAWPHDAAAAASPGRHRAGVSRATSRRSTIPSSAIVTGRLSGLPEDDPRRTALRIANPLSDEEPLLRTTLLPGLLRTLARNVGRGQTDIGLFEMGSVVLPAGEPVKAPRLGVDRRPTDDELKQLEAALPDQPLHVGFVLSGSRGQSGWWGSGTPSSWADAVEACRAVAAALGIEVEVASRPAGAVASGPVRGDPASATSSSAMPASCIRRSARRSACPLVRRPASSTSMC